VEHGDSPEVGAAEQPQALVVREVLEGRIRHTRSLRNVLRSRKGHKSQNRHDRRPRFEAVRGSGK
jgi:hypothetical protein